MNPFLLNPARMYFQVPDVLGGLLLAGAKGERRRRPGNGDCLLLDGASGLLGLADGSDRSPQASREFLEGISGRLNGIRVGTSEDLFRSFLEAVQAVLDSFRYEERTTFICLLAAGDGSLYYISGGDSLLFHLAPRTSRVLFRNQANMAFAGRSRHIVDSGRLEFGKGDLVLMASDGAWDLTGGNSEELVKALFSALKQGPFHETPERLARERHPAFLEGHNQPHDDFSVILADPFRLGEFSGRVITGGTSGTQEDRYRLRRRQGSLPDRYLPLAGREPDFWRFPEDLSSLESPPEETSEGG